MRPPSGPEKRVASLLSLLNLPLARNDGLRKAEKIYLRADQKGTSVIRGEWLYTDVAARNNAPTQPKSFHSITPDYSGGPFFVEVKGAISGNRWEGLSRDACNDNLRLALLRMRRGSIDDRRVEYRDLDRSV